MSEYTLSVDGLAFVPIEVDDRGVFDSFIAVGIGAVTWTKGKHRLFFFHAGERSYILRASFTRKNRLHTELAYLDRETLTWKNRHNLFRRKLERIGGNHSMDLDVFLKRIDGVAIRLAYAEGLSRPRKRKRPLDADPDADVVIKSEPVAADPRADLLAMLRADMLLAVWAARVPEFHVDPPPLPSATHDPVTAFVARSLSDFVRFPEVEGWRGDSIAIFDAVRASMNYAAFILPIEPRAEFYRTLDAPPTGTGFTAIFTDFVDRLYAANMQLRSYAGSLAWSADTSKSGRATRETLLFYCDLVEQHVITLAEMVAAQGRARTAGFSPE